MNLYKYINEYEIKKFTGGFVVIDNYIYTNPNYDTLYKIGYRPLVVEDIPSYNEETQYIIEKYTLTEEAIIKTYEIHDIPIEEEEDV